MMSTDYWETSMSHSPQPLGRGPGHAPRYVTVLLCAGPFQWFLDLLRLKQRLSYFEASDTLSHS
jgi:hypothetical protein